MITLMITMAALGGLPGEPMLLADDVTHVKVYYEPGRFGGWPANHGIWNWGDEILVGYSRGYYKDLGPTRHHIDREKPEEFWMARSLDGGLTWNLEHPAEKGFLIPRGKFLHGTETPGQALPPVEDLKEPMDFTHPDFVLPSGWKTLMGACPVSSTPTIGVRPGKVRTAFRILAPRVPPHGRITW